MNTESAQFNLDSINDTSDEGLPNQSLEQSKILMKIDHSNTNVNTQKQTKMQFLP